MRTITSEQFKKLYGNEAVTSFDVTQKVTPVERNLTDIVGEDINTRVGRVSDILSRQDTGAITKGVQVFGQGAGLAANTLEQTAMKVPVLKQAIGAVGAGINWLTTSDMSPIKALGDVIGNSKTLQTAVSLYDGDQNFKDTVDAVANIVRLGGDVDTVVNSANFATNVTNKIIKNIKNVPDVVPPDGGGGATTKIPTQAVSASIMNRVARLKPTDMTSFEKMSNGKTVGQYLTETGNFGAPDKIISNEAIKFTQSKAIVDTEMEKLPGVYKNGAVSDALTSLAEKAKSVSTDNVPATYRSQVQDLIRKYNAGGLDMSEINQVKRLYERNVKLGYNKLLNADKVEQATNIDNAIRKWQIQKAKDLGFKNVEDLNKQTQLSKFIVDKLGDQVIGQGALNSIGLTDWIVLGGGSPQAVAGFLTKKFFSSRAVQAKIAEMLNVGEPVKGLIEGKSNPTTENIIRRQWPEGTKLELPEGKTKVPTGTAPIKVGPASSMEAPAQKIFNESMNNTSIQPSVNKIPDNVLKAQRDIQEAIKLREKAPDNVSIEESYINGTKDKEWYTNYINETQDWIDRKIGSGVKSNTKTQPLPQQEKVLGKSSSKTLPQSDINASLIQEAKKYKSAEEFVKAQDRGYGMQHRPTETGATADNISQTKSEMGFPKDFYDKPNYYADMSNKVDLESFNVLKKIKDKPNADITIYRASPKNELNRGDWISLSKEYAKGESLSENVPVQSFKVKAKDVQFAGDSINEFGYYPKGKTVKESQLTDIWNKANNK